ncbi:hypothetical protein BKD09_01950 [Bradyrhizobium japonicum]|uniref:Uncharacterized protein n=1 Tax=Bradyrhizobium japonicum TaxID=375 RepID=A0A1L3F1C6_BRAJP|nr:hypothetical protein BKD09_01950 [Bradyrhizobium japonicum]
MTCEKPNKTGHFQSRRIQTVGNRGGDPRFGQPAIIPAPAEAPSSLPRGLWGAGKPGEIAKKPDRGSILRDSTSEPHPPPQIAM